MLQKALVVVGVLVAVLSTAVLPVAAQGDAGSDVDARALFDEGRAAYDAGRFEDAVRAFRRAYVLSPRYQLLYNIGQAELRAGHDDRALQAFEGFLRQAPADSAQYSEVQERVTVLRGMGVTPSTAPQDAPAPAEDTATPTATTAPEPEPAEPPAAPSSGGGVGPWILVGAGAAVLVAGAVMMGVGVAEAQRVTDAPIGSRWVDLQGAADSANTLWGVGIGAAAVGLAALGAGIVWAVTSGSGSATETADAGPQLRVGLGSLSVEGEF